MLLLIAKVIIINLGLFSLYWNVLQGYNYIDQKPFNCITCIFIWIGWLSILLSLIPYFYLFCVPLTLNLIYEKYD